MTSRDCAALRILKAFTTSRSPKRTSTGLTSLVYKLSGATVVHCLTYPLVEQIASIGPAESSLTFNLQKM